MTSYISIDRKIVVEATQISSPEDIERIVEWIHRLGGRAISNIHRDGYGPSELLIYHPRGPRTAYVSDFIVQETDGQFYAVTYESFMYLYQEQKDSDTEREIN